MADAGIVLPYKFTPRFYQLPMLDAIEHGCKRVLCVWHRRAGKDKCFIALLVRKAFERVGVYQYFLPTSVMARRIIWSGMDDDGFRFIDHIPHELIDKKSERDMSITLVNGSTIQLIGTDTLNIVGTNPIGTVFSEYSLQNPKAWSFVQPILRANGGFAYFNGTPRGKNHLYKLLQITQDDSRWFTEVLTVDDTRAVDVAEIERDIRTGQISRDMANQEYYCNFNQGIDGSYYSKYVDEAEKEGRICNLPWETNKPVFTSWDLGQDNAQAIWFFQIDGRFMNFIDYYENQNEGISHYAEVLKEKRYNYGGHFAPWDVVKRESNGITMQGNAEKVGIFFDKVKRTSAVTDDIEMVRRNFGFFRFDKVKCAYGLDMLRDYHAKKNEAMSTEGRPVFTNKPEHSASSDCFTGETLISITRGDVRIDEVVKGDEVVLGDVEALVTDSWFVGWRNVYEIELTTGEKLRITGNNPIFTQEGVAFADTLRHSDVISTKENGLWVSTMKKNVGLLDEVLLFMVAKSFGSRKTTEVTALKKAINTDSYIKCFIKDLLQKTSINAILNQATGLRLKIEKEDITEIKKELFLTRKHSIWKKMVTGGLRNMVHCIDMFGKNIKAKFLKDMQYIMWIGIKTIMRLITWNSLQRANIAYSMQKTINGLEVKRIKINLEKQVNCQKNGMQAKREEFGTHKILKRLGKLENIIRKFVFFATRNIQHHSLQDQNTVQSNVKAITAIGKRKVYDITVEKHHAFYANGILVKNCSDSFRTGVRAWELGMVRSSHRGGLGVRSMLPRYGNYLEEDQKLSLRKSFGGWGGGELQKEENYLQ